MLAHATTGDAQSEIYEVLSLGDTETPLQRTYIQPIQYGLFCIVTLVLSIQ